MEKLPTISQISGKDLQFKRDRTTKEIMKRLKQCQEASEHFSDWVYGEFDIPVNGTRRKIAKALNALIPRWAYDYMPAVAEFVAEESDVSYFMESRLRENVNDLIELVKNLKRSTEYEEEKLSKLLDEIAVAEKEKWDAKTIKERFIELVNEDALREGEKIPTDEEVTELLDARSERFSAEEKEKRRSRLLKRARNNATGRKQLVETDRYALAVTLEGLEVGEFQLIDFLTVIKPMRDLENASKHLVQFDKSLFISKDVVIKMAQLTAASFGEAVNALAQAPAYAISGRDTIELFSAVKEHIHDKLIKLEESRNNILALEEKRQKILLTSEAKKIEDAVVVKTEPA